MIFNVLNALQEVQLNDERTDLLFHFRKNVKNSFIELSINVIPSEDGDDAPKTFLTDKERYMDMIFFSRSGSGSGPGSGSGSGPNRAAAQRQPEFNQNR